MTTFTNTKGSFWSWEVRERQLAGVWPTELSEEFAKGFGYFAGGFNNLSSISNTTGIDRLNFNTETLGVGAVLAYGIQEHVGVSGNNIGWFGGGGPTGATVSSIQRINFSNLSSSVSPGRLSSARSRLSGVSNSSFGWFAGGSSSNTIDRLTFSTETTAVSPAALSRSRINFQNAGTEGNGFGWFGGGYGISPNARVSTVERLNLSAQTLTISPATLSSARDWLAATASNAAAWFSGGSLPGVQSTMDRLTFSTETRASSPARFFMQEHGGTTGNFNGWFTGYGRSSIYRLNFSEETANLLSTRTSTSRRYLAAATSRT
jgi:hypothetical protein